MAPATSDVLERGPLSLGASLRGTSRGLRLVTAAPVVGVRLPRVAPARTLSRAVLVEVVRSPMRAEPGRGLRAESVVEGRLPVTGRPVT